MARILVIDDNDLIRDFIVDALEHEGHSVMTASNGDDATESFRPAGFDLIITDILMPKKEGIYVIQTFKRACPSVKILAISGAGKKNQYLQHAKDFGADEVLDKPCSLESLQCTVKRLLGTE